MTATRICLVRHGETAWNAERRIQGQLDAPLNATGVAQARAAANGLLHEDFAALYASDLGRARQTAEAAAHVLKLPIRPEPDLRERHYGMFQTHTYEEVGVRFPAEWSRFAAREPDFALPGGESLRQFAERVIGCVSTLAKRHAGAQLLLVTHGGVLDIVYRRATGMALEAPRDFEIPNAALNWVVIDESGWWVSAWAERGHLAAALDDLPG